MNRIIVALLLLFTIASGCSSQRHHPRQKIQPSYHSLSAQDRQLADTLIKKVLDNEGLYTVISGLKPMSSASDLVLKVAQPDSMLCGASVVTDTASADYQKLKRYQQIVNALQFGDLKFIILPFKMQRKGDRIMQINIYRQSLVDSLVSANASFYGQFGFAPGTDAQLLINTTEFENKYDRFRSYGNLFGYPAHAVNFFVEAAIVNDRTGVFVKRDFYQIPVFNNTQGHFVYALPKGTLPNAVDKEIKARAEYALLQYQHIRKKFLRKDGTLRAYDLMMALLKSGRKS